MSINKGKMYPFCTAVNNCKNLRKNVKAREIQNDGNKTGKFFFELRCSPNKNLKQISSKGL